MKLRAIATAVPDWAVDSATVADWSGLGADFLSTKIGVAERRFLRHDETTSGLAAAACERLFAAEPTLDRSRIGLLVLVTQNPDHRLPHTSAQLQHMLGLPQTTACFDLNLGCSGYVYGLSVAKAMMVAEGMTDALLVTCDPYSKIMRRESREVIGLFGDGATATWLSTERGATIGRGDFGTDGSGAQNLIVKAGGAAYPAYHLDGTDADPASVGDSSLFMNGRAIFNFMQTRVPAAVARCLERNGHTSEEIDQFVFHQASRFMLESLADRMKIARDRVPIVLERVGNTVSSTIPMVLADLIARDRHRNQRLLLCGFGVGLSWASNILEFGSDT